LASGRLLVFRRYSPEQAVSPDARERAGSRQEHHRRNGTTFDLQGSLVGCEGDDRRLTRMDADGKVESLVDNYKGGRFNRPNDVICH
jgi:gluconolactonase